MTLDEAIEFAKPNPHGEVTTYKWLVELKEARLEIERQRALIERCVSYAKQLKARHYPDTTNSLVDEWIKDAEGGGY